MKCPNCQADADPGARYCTNCRNPLTREGEVAQPGSTPAEPVEPRSSRGISVSTRQDVGTVGPGATVAAVVQGATGGLTIVGGQHHHIVNVYREGTGAIRLDPSEVQMPIESQVDLALWSRTDLQSTPETDLKIVADENEKIWEYFVTEEAYNTRLVELRHFTVMEYFPISPGAYHTPCAKGVREEAERHKLPDSQPADSGRLAETKQTAYNVYGKAYMLRGGIGAVRLNPWEVFGEPYYFMTASSNGICHQGFPVLVPFRFYGMLKSRINREGGGPATLKGTMKYVEKLPTIFGSDRRIPRLFLVVTEQPEMNRHHRIQVQQDGHVVSVAVSFFGTSKGRQDFYSAYVTFNPADDVDRRRSCEWLERDYIRGLYQGEVVTDFDEVMTKFPDARFGLPVVMSGRLDLERALEFLKSKGSWVGPADQRFVSAYYQPRLT